MHLSGDERFRLHSQCKNRLGNNLRAQTTHHKNYAARKRRQIVCLVSECVHNFEFSDCVLSGVDCKLVKVTNWKVHLLVINANFETALNRTCIRHAFPQNQARISHNPGVQNSGKLPLRNCHPNAALVLLDLYTAVQTTQELYLAP